MARSAILTRRGPKKKMPQSKLEKKIITQKYWGDKEPAIPNDIMEGGRYADALTWYGNMGEYLEGTPKSWVLSMLKAQGRRDIYDRLKSVPDKWIPTTLSSQARLIKRGARLSEGSLLFQEKALHDALRHEGATDDEDVEDNNETAASKPTIQDRTKEKTSEIIGELEGLIDDGFWDGFKLDAWYREKNAKPATIKTIITRFGPVLEELREAKRGKDAQLNEAYSFLTKDDIQVYIEMYEWLIDDSTRFITNVKQTRAPRVSKPPSIEKKIKFLKEVYQKRSAEYNIESIPPERILGAQELWTFNSKYKILTVFRAGSHGGALDVARCKVAGYDKNTSVSKRTGRKTAEVIDKLMKASKPQLRKFMDELKGDGIKLQDKINLNTILLRSFS